MPSLGDQRSRLLIVGLAPAAHGANRTGQMFTGDSSGSWLYEALHRYGWSNRPNALRRNDGLVLTDCRITAAAHCAPPGNKPTREELARCRRWLEAELALLPDVRVVLALGRVGWESLAPGCRVVGPAAAAGAAAVRARPRGDAAGRHGAGHVVPPEPPEHEHGEAHAGDVVRRLRADTENRPGRIGSSA